MGGLVDGFMDDSRFHGFEAPCRLLVDLRVEFGAEIAAFDGLIVS